MTSVPPRRSLQVQLWSGLLFSFFLLVHLLNQMVASAGQEPYDAVQQTLQRGYQTLPLELFLVITPLLIHVTVSLWRAWARRAEPGPTGWRPRLHRYSGRFLAVFFLGHVIATRGPSLLANAWPGFRGVAFTFQWMPVYFWPYYSLLAASGWYHLLHGLSVALPAVGLKAGLVLQRPSVFRTVVALGWVALFAGILGFGGVWRDVGEVRSLPFAQLVLRLSGTGP